MKVKDLIGLGGETMYQVVDASLQGYRTRPVYLHSGGDRNVIGDLFGDYDVVAFDVPKKNNLVIFATEPYDGWDRWECEPSRDDWDEES